MCCDTQTEHVLNSQSLGIGRVNHILRVHGHRLARDSAELQAFDGAARSTADRLFPGLTDESHKQAALSVRLGGFGMAQGDRRRSCGEPCSTRGCHA